MDEDIIEAEANPVTAVVPAKRRHARPPSEVYRHIPPEKQLAMKADYLTGSFDSRAIAEKYGCHRNQVLHLISHGWGKDLEKTGINPPFEQSKGRRDIEGFYDLILHEFLEGASLDDLAHKYHLSKATLDKASRRFGWLEKRKALGAKLTNHVTGILFQKSGQYASRMNDFYDKATEQLGKWIAKFDDYKDDDMPIKDLEIFTRAFRNMVDSGRLIYNPPQGNGPAINPTPNNPGFVRINVMNGAAVTVAAHQPAKCIEIEG